MRKRWAIIIIVPLIFGFAYFATYEIAKKSYYDSIKNKIDGVAADRYYDALSSSYPILKESANAVIIRADALKRIASEICFYGHFFPMVWTDYNNSAEAQIVNDAFNNLDPFIGSNTYSFITQVTKQNKKTASSIIGLITARRKIQDIVSIIDMDSIMHVADSSRQIAFDCLDAIGDYANNSHSINDWRNFDATEYDERIRKYIKLQKEPFSLYDYFFNNPLDKEK